jgi:hypothetical protein
MSANDVRIDPNDPNTVYATLWQQQESFIEGRAFGGSEGKLLADQGLELARGHIRHGNPPRSPDLSSVGYNSNGGPGGSQGRGLGSRRGAPKAEGFWTPRR